MVVERVGITFFECCARPGKLLLAAKLPRAKVSVLALRESDVQEQWRR